MLIHKVTWCSWAYKKQVLLQVSRLFTLEELDQVSAALPAGLGETFLQFYKHAGARVNSNSKLQILGFHNTQDFSCFQVM